MGRRELARLFPLEHVPGVEKRLTRYAQFYSRIGFVHEFRPLGTTEIRRLLAERWTPAGVNLPEQPWAEEAIAGIIRHHRGQLSVAESAPYADGENSRNQFAARRQQRFGRCGARESGDRAGLTSSTRVPIRVLPQPLLACWVAQTKVFARMSVCG